jgi:hypothetical protein
MDNDEEVLVDEIFKGLERSHLVIVSSESGEWPLVAEINGKYFGIEVTQIIPEDEQ